MSRRLRFFGGKGGVGKTTVATAAAMMLANEGRRTLLVSTDPAHSTADLLGMPLGADAAAVQDNLWALEIDPEAAAAAHLEQVRAVIAPTVEPDLLPAIDRQLGLAAGSPGTIESALFDRMVTAMQDPAFDAVVFDTAPTGHTLRLLALPGLLAAWVEGLARQRERVMGMERMLRNMAGTADPGSDTVLQRMHARRERFQAAGRALREDALFWLVVIPERLPIEETARAARTLEAAEIQIGGVIVNRVLPDEADGEFLAARRDAQRAYLAEIRQRFAGRSIVEVEQLPHDVTTPAQLAAISAQIGAVAQGG
ncbi:MAG TPA: ArsA family ATPase [Egibacteraceae bacterium]|nr:ArsA family ATPase [Egibacteraceae bacterium]